MSKFVGLTDSSLLSIEDGTYQGGVSDFKEGWAVVAAAVREHAPSVKMWFTPNVRSLEQYDEYYPDDPSTVDIIGMCVSSPSSF